MKPLAIDLYCGLGGWSAALLAEGYDVIGFDIERHSYGDQAYPAQLVVQDVLTLHGSQFRDAALIVASPPCQFFSYTAMPWSRAKDLARQVRADPARLADQLALFHACFRLQREASAAAGHHIPLIVENVRGAIPWVGRSRWNFGPFHLWGDVPALMPHTFKAQKVPGFRFNGNGGSFQSASVERTGRKSSGMNGNDWFGAGDDCSLQRMAGSKSPARKAASAMIAKIPEPLARHIAQTFKPRGQSMANVAAARHPPTSPHTQHCDAPQSA